MAATRTRISAANADACRSATPVRIPQALGIARERLVRSDQARLAAAADLADHGCCWQRCGELRERARAFVAKLATRALGAAPDALVDRLHLIEEQAVVADD